MTSIFPSNIGETQQTTLRVTMTGALITAVTIKLTKRGVTKFMSISGTVATGASATNTVNFPALTIPATYLPLAVSPSTALPVTIGLPVRIVANGSDVMGLLNIFQDGSMTIGSDLSGSSFTATQSTGLTAGGINVEWI